MSKNSLVPDDFEVPEQLSTERFLMRMLTIHDVDKDFEAVTSNTEHLQRVWGNNWPLGLTLEQNLIDLGWHQKEFQRRTSFAYTVVAPDESAVLGCVYIYPSDRPQYDAEIYLWARQDIARAELEDHLEQTTRDWIAECWPFSDPVFPGKDMPIDEWNNTDE